MAKVILYGAFFKHMIVRKKQQMLNPRSHGVSDITLPIHSVIHYLPKNNTELGPPPSETFISNYPTENIFINFAEGYETPVGKYRTVPFEVRKAINKYRGSHFNYSWTRNTDLVYNKRDNLIVWNHALAKQGIRQKQSLFNSYENYYNDMVNLVNQINAVAAKPFKRQQYVKVDLPNQLPAFTKLLTDFRHFEKMKSEVTEENPHGFEIKREVIKNTKGEECYWLLDLMAFLYKDVEDKEDGNLPISVFSRLTEEAKASLNVIFTYQSECIIFNLGLLESWYKEVKQEAQRLNAYKRLYISFIKLTNNTGAIIETSKEETQPEEEGHPDIDVEDTEEAIDDTTTDILDVFAMAEQDDDALDETTEGEGGPDNTGQVSVSWTDTVDEELLEEADVTDIETTVNKDKFNTLTAGIERSLINKAKEGSLTTKEQKFFMDKAETYKSLTLGNGQTVEEFIQINPEELTKLKENAVVTGSFNTVNEEGLKRARSTELRKGYVEKFYHKDLLHCLVGFQHSGIAISNLEISEYADKESEYEEYRVQFHPVGGSPSTRPIKMPKINKHGNFRINGVNSVLKNQRMELPIRKTAPDTVIMTSYYDKKLIVKRSPNVADNYGLWLIKQILNSKNPELSFSLGGTRAKGFETPYYYNLLSSKFKSITVNGMTLNFELRRLLKDKPELKKQFSKDKAYLGVKGENVITMDRDGIISCGDDSWDLPELLNINTLKAPVEFVNINLNGYKYPIGVLLSFYFGFDDLIKLTKAKYRSVPPTERLKLTNNEYAIKFNDETLVFDRNDRFNSLIFGGLTKFKGTANFNRVDLNNSGVWLPLINDPKVKSNHFTEFDNLLRLFIDPITKEELKRLKYSVDFDHLLLDAVGLLVHNNHKHEVDITEQRIVGYERFAGHLYRELCRENRLYQNRPGGKRVFSIAPDAVINNIITDTSVNQVEETNLIHQLKDQEEMTFAGVGGRVDTAMVASTREQLDSYKGIVSEGHKDSQKVGYVTYGSSDTNLADYRGNISTDKVEDTNLLSVAGNLYYGTLKDDSKRSSFASIQTSQIIASNAYAVNPMRTSYESIMAHRGSELYSKVAKQDGEVTEVTDQYMSVTYKDGTTDTYELGYYVGEAAGEYHKHNRVTDLKVGDKFKLGDIIGFNETWLARDIFNPGQVAMKTGIMTRMVLMDAVDTFEDSISVSLNFSNISTSPYIKRKGFMLDAEDRLVMKVKEGDSVDYDTILCEIEEGHLAALSSGEDSQIDEINRLGIRQIKSHHHGIITKIDVSYNCEVESMSESVGKLVKAKDKLTKQLAKATNSQIVDNRVSSVGAKQTVMEGKVKITIHIESNDASVVADKLVVGNQMKGTINSIYNEVITTKDGRPVDLKFSFKSLFARMVLSLRDKLIGNELTEHVTKQAIDIYRGK